jgi:DNA replication protein DnaD
VKKRGALSNGTVRNKHISKYQNSTVEPVKAAEIPGYIQNYQNKISMLTGRSYGANNFGMNQNTETSERQRPSESRHSKNNSKLGNNSLISKSMNLGGDI